MEICCIEFRDEIIRSLWEKLHDRLLRFILSRVDNPDDAHDILQTVFLKIHSKLETVTHVDRMESWVFQIARNCITDYYRQSGLTSLDESYPSIDRYASDDPTGEIARYVHSIVKSLPDIYRQAVEMVDLNGISQQEAARELGISVSGLKSRVQRGRNLVREIMLACCHFEFDSQGILMEYYPSCCHCRNKEN